MLKNLIDYFCPEHEIALESVEYKRLNSDISKLHQMTCTDSLNVKKDSNNTYVLLILTRSLEFEPKELFDLSVTFSARLKIKEEKKDEVDWNEINLAEEFRKNGNFVLDRLIDRITLMIGQITSSYGQPPIMLPARFAPMVEE